MNAPTLWDARLSDPATSHSAAEAVRPARRALIEAIRGVLTVRQRPLTAFDIALWVDIAHPGRWDEGTIRTACSRAGLRAVDNKGVSPRGTRCLRYELGPRP